MQVEDVSRVGLPARGPAQEEGELPVRPCVLGQVVIDDEGVHPLLHEVFTDCACRKRGKVLHCGRSGRAGRHDDGVAHCPFFGELRHGAGNRSPLLSDGAVHADHLGKVQVTGALVDDGVHHEGSLSRVAVPDNELPLATADGGERIHHLDPRLQGDFHGSTLRHPRGNALEGDAPCSW